MTPQQSAQHNSLQTHARSLFASALAPGFTNAFAQRQTAAARIAQLRDAQQPVEITCALAQGYRFALCDESVTFPFQLTPELLYRASIFAKLPLDERAYALFTYLHDSLDYGTSRRVRGTNYALSTEVWKQRQGVCGEMSYLYVSLARFAGLRSSYVSVSRDVDNKKVCHACAGVQTTAQAPLICADIAYHTFDIKHKSYKPISDETAWELFKSWR